MLYCGDIWWLLIKKKGHLGCIQCTSPAEHWFSGNTLSTVTTWHDGVSPCWNNWSAGAESLSVTWFKDVFGWLRQIGLSPPWGKKKREARRHKPPERGKEIAIQQASDDCQFSSTADVMQTYAALTLLSAMSSFSCSSSSSFPLYFPQSVFALLICSAALSLSTCTLFFSSRPHFEIPFFLLSILSTGMSGWSEALCPGDCDAIRFSFVSVCVCVPVRVYVKCIII